MKLPTLIVGLALGLTSNVLAQQYNFAPIAGPTAAANTTWLGGYNLGTSTANTYTTYFIAADYIGSTAAADQWSNEARVSLHGSALGATPGTSSAGPAGSGTIHFASGSATGSAGNINPVANMYWTGTLGSSFVSTGANDLYLSHRQTFSATTPVNGLSNIRVVLNPNITSGTVLGTGVAVPSTYTDLGTLVVGATSLDIAASNSNTGAAGFNWYRFQVDSNVNSLSNVFDMYTQGASDTRLTLFRNVPGQGLFAVASTDDIPSSGFQAGLTFGSSNTTQDTRPYLFTGSTFFNGQGGNTTLAALSPFGYFANTAGAATLSAGTEYFVALSQFSGSAPFTTTVSGITISPTSVNIGSTINMGLGNPTVALGSTTFSIRSVPEPSALILVALAGIAGYRRRRA
jgi:hypothetical protein